MNTTFTVGELAVRWRCRFEQAVVICNWLVARGWVDWAEDSDELLVVTDAGVDASCAIGELVA